jgi:four helix bundle protein
MRPTLGRRLEEAILNCLINIRKASVAKSQSTRLKNLLAADESLDEFRTLIQLSSELRELNMAGFSELSKQSKEIGRELGGWIKHESGQ